MNCIFTKGENDECIDVNGQPRLHGNTAALCKPFMEELKENGAEVRYVTLANKDINPCKGCYACQEVSDSYGCCQKGDDMMELTHILRNFLDANGKLTAFPAKRKMKIYCLFYLAQKFESKKDYTEQEINNVLLDWHTFADPATLRRELYDYGFLDRSRDGKVYRLAEEQPTPEDLGV